MNEEKIKEMTEAYIKNYVRPNKKVAEQAYSDGLKDAIKFIKDKLNEL